MKKQLAFLFVFYFAAAAFVFAQSYEVQGAGLQEANGIYNPSGTINNKICYKKGEYTLFYKGCVSKWMITSPVGNLYRNANDTEFPPREGWLKGCAKESKDPLPIIIPVNQTITQSKK
jgi:hypothetical protein